MSFSLRIRGQLLEVEIRPEAVTYVLAEGSELVIQHEGNEIRLSGKNPRAVCPGPRVERKVPGQVDVTKFAG
jgi:hypothetical protein